MTDDKIITSIVFRDQNGATITAIPVVTIKDAGALIPIQGDEIIIDKTGEVYIVTRVIIDYHTPAVIAEIQKPQTEEIDPELEQYLKEQSEIMKEYRKQ